MEGAQEMGGKIYTTRSEEEEIEEKRRGSDTWPKRKVALPIYERLT